HHRDRYFRRTRAHRRPLCGARQGAVHDDGNEGRKFAGIPAGGDLRGLTDQAVNNCSFTTTNIFERPAKDFIRGLKPKSWDREMGFWSHSQYVDYVQVRAGVDRSELLHPAGESRTAQADRKFQMEPANFLQRAGSFAAQPTQVRSGSAILRGTKGKFHSF